jgi:hypothetical protein
MNATQYCLSIVILACLTTLPAYAGTNKSKASHRPRISHTAKAPDKAEIPGQVSIADSPTKSNTGSIANRGRFSFAPLPVDVYLRPKEKPTVAFTTPCIMIEKATHGFPPILAFETFMFQAIGNVNESNMLPARLEPVCV